jgi:hypothetical protein
MLREGGWLAPSDFAKVATHSALLKAESNRNEIAWRAGRTKQFHACAREIRFSRAERLVVRAEEILTAFLELAATIRLSGNAGTRCFEKGWQMDSLWIKRLTKS